MSDYTNHCVYVFNQDGEQIHKIGKGGQGIGEFHHPFGMALENKFQILTEELKYHSMLGICLLNIHLIKVTRDRILVLDGCDPCMSLFASAGSIKTPMRCAALIISCAGCAAMC